MIVTDYTESVSQGAGQQYRIIKYIKDVLNNWFADSRNIKDQRLLRLLYTPQGELNKDCIRLGCAFDPQKTYAGTTPAIVISLGDIQYSQRPVTMGMSSAFPNNPTEPIIGHWRTKIVPIQVSVITQSYDGTVLLTQLLQLFLLTNSYVIAADCNGLSSFDVQAVQAPKELPPGQSGNAKHVFASSVGIHASTIVSWKQDTQGPVFKGIGIQKL